ncbi:hypothetical protein FACS1894172_01730 [Spirochaetia bacterium]|nr:hypothetical protein FACS1894164_12900 [Spirochaetia bacterium]GHU29813.1 hypothetical protein FACS1894172_01730 [Spirochaetia bacterium]
MAKISNAQREQYTQRIKFYQNVIDGILKKEQSILVEIEKRPDEAALKRFMLSEVMLNLTSNYIVQSGVSVAFFKIKNENALNEGRKAVFRSLIYLEDIVTGWVDAPYSDYEDKVEKLDPVKPEVRYALVKKLGLTIQLLENAYGDNSKWKWSFVDMEGRFAAVTKNIFDLKNMVANTDPRSPVYETTVYFLRTVKRLLSQSADRYREKYELSSHRSDDFKAAINFLNALRRIQLLQGATAEAETVKKKADAWLAKLDADEKKQS